MNNGIHFALNIPWLGSNTTKSDSESHDNDHENDIFIFKTNRLHTVNCCFQWRLNRNVITRIGRKTEWTKKKDGMNSEMNKNQFEYAKSYYSRSLSCFIYATTFGKPFIHPRNHDLHFTKFLISVIVTYICERVCFHPFFG